MRPAARQCALPVFAVSAVEQCDRASHRLPVSWRRGEQACLDSKLDSDLGFDDETARDSSSSQLLLEPLPVGLRDGRRNEIRWLGARRLQVEAQHTYPGAIRK